MRVYNGMYYRKCHKLSESAVSEAIGFVLVLAIVITAIGMITMYGYPLLTKEQTNTNIKNIERSFVSLQSDINSLTFKQIPYKESLIQINDGTLKVVTATQMATSTTPKLQFDPPIPSTTAGNPDLITFYPGDIRFTTSYDDYSIALQNGALISRWATSEGSVIQSNPRWFYDSSTKKLVINLFQINTPSTDSLSKSGISRIEMKLIGQEFYQETITGGNPLELTQTVNIEEPYAHAWYLLFKDIQDTFNSYQPGAALANEPAVNTARLTITPTSPFDIVVNKYSIQILNL